MTREELETRHMDIWADSIDNSSHYEVHADLSVKFAINVLEELLKAEDDYDIFLHDITKKKLKELKLLLE